MTQSRTNRRQFLQTTAVISAGYWVAGGVQAQESSSPNERIAMASVGIGGKGDSDSRDAAKHGDMVAICDADRNTLGNAAKREGFGKAKKYTDFRKMLEELGDSIDAVTVSTPDHTHAPAALMAMRMGKHCFCQKPLTRSVYEARLMGQVAREKGLATQMGNQGTASPGLRRAAAWLRAGVLGTVQEVHVWTNRPIWPQGVLTPKEGPCPDSLDWEAWIGAAPMRPFASDYHPFRWRGWWDFGTGALGDMACHNINMPFMGLDLRDPISIQAATSGHNRNSFPKSSTVTYEFAPNEWRDGLKLVWYDGGALPPEEICDGMERRAEGSLVIGEKGKLWGDGHLMAGAEKVDVEFPQSPGHFEEWIRAIRGGEPAMSNFPNYAGPLAETVLAGNLAVWVAVKEGPGTTLAWDAKNMAVKNMDGLETLIKPEYRNGYTLDA